MFVRANDCVYVYGDNITVAQCIVMCKEEWMRTGITFCCCGFMTVISLTFISGRSNLLLLLYWIKLKTDTAEYFILSLDGGTF